MRVRGAIVGAVALSGATSAAYADTCPSLLGGSNFEAPSCYRYDIMDRLEPLGFARGERVYTREEPVERVSPNGTVSQIYDSAIPITGDYSRGIAGLTADDGAELNAIRADWTASVTNWVCENACHAEFGVVCDFSRQNLIKSGGSITWTLNLTLETEQGPRVLMPDGEPLASATVTSCEEVN